MITILEIPSLNIRAPPKGAIDARIKNITPTEDVISEILHPNSLVIGIIKTWGVLNAAEEKIEVKNPIKTKKKRY